MNKLLLLFTLIPCLAFGQMTYVPDDNFEQALIDLGYDTGIPDDSVPTANIDMITSLSVSNNSISDLTGIEDFAALTKLWCSWNQLTSLDVSNNTALNGLDCSGNQLTSLDVSNNSLTVLLCYDNQLTSLDVSNSTALDGLDCSGNQLTSLDVSNNSLIALLCYDNQLTCLNIKNGNNQMIQWITADNNPLLNCIEVDDTNYSTTNWLNNSDYIFDAGITFSEDCNNPCSSTTGIPEPPTKPKELLYITDILGRTTLPTPNTLLFYLYDDGSVEKRIQLER